jgi:hypothetical protein
MCDEKFYRTALKYDYVFAATMPRGSVMGGRVHLPEAVARVFVTDELYRRPQPDADYLGEKPALQDLAGQMTNRPTEILARLVKLGMEICGAASAGIGILEPESEQFRWFGLHGVLSSFGQFARSAKYWIALKQVLPQEGFRPAMGYVL